MNIKRLGRQLSIKYAEELIIEKDPFTQKSFHTDKVQPHPKGPGHEVDVEMVPFTYETGIAHVPTERETRHSLQNPQLSLDSLHPLKSKLIYILGELGKMEVIQLYYMKQMIIGIQNAPLTKLGPFYNEILDALDAAEKHAQSHLEAVQQLKNKL